MMMSMGLIVLRGICWTLMTIKEIKARVLLDWADRELARNERKKRKNIQSAKYALQERQLKNGTFDGPAPRRLAGFRDIRRVK